ncbi:glycosyltransferase family 2 protein [Isoptericola sp. NPDC057391]|uniref:glycosyltransferase family 2 protein n=1 Tax=Isoptericola sp. NPDC057391 TaxID=3346117 RepID=UPI003630418F
MPDAPTTTVSVEAVGAAWIDGTLYLRTITRWSAAPADAPAAAPTQIVLRERDGDRTIVVPTVGDLRAVNVTDDDGAVAIQTESRLDPRRATKGAWLPEAVWDVRARTRGPAGTVTVPVATTVGAGRPALVAGRQLVAYRNQKGHLSVDSGGSLRSAVNDSRPRLGGVTVEATDGAARQVTATIPLDGVHVHGRGTLVGVATADPVGRSLGRRAVDAALRRVAPPSPPKGTARLTATREDVTLSFDVALRPGRWRVVLQFAGTAKPSPFFLTVPRSGPATVDVAEADGRATEPDVSVVVTGDDGDALRDAVGSALDQSLSPQRVDVIVVPGPAGHEAAAWLRELAASDRRVRVATPPSPGAAAARNAGLDLARGRHVTFVDGDDRLTPHALEKLTEAADAAAADVVLGTVLGITRRRAMPKAFTATVLDADVVDQRLYDTFTPHQLFRRSLLAEHGIRFVEDVADTESGALFAAEATFRAKRLVTLADAVYYERFVTGEVTPEDVAPAQKAEGVLRVAEEIARHVEPGPRRDAIMRRPAAALMDMASALSGMDEAELDALATSVGERFGPYWTTTVRAGQAGRRALLLDTLLSGDGAAIADLLAVAGPDGTGLVAVADGAPPRFDVPASVHRVVEDDRLFVPASAVKHLLTALDVHDGVANVTGWVGASGLLRAPDGVRATLLLRGAEEGVPAIDLPVALDAPPAHVPDDATGFTLRIDPATLTAPGRWDLYVAPIWSGHALPGVRFGSRRPTHVDEVSVDVTGRPLGSPDTVLYATAGYGNLSVSHQDFLRSGSVDVIRLAVDEDGRPEVVLSTDRQDDLLRFDADVTPAGGREAPHRLPWRRLPGSDGQEVAVRLPVPTHGELRCVLSAAHKDVLAEVRLPDDPPKLRAGQVVARLADGAFFVSRPSEKEPA